MLRDGNYGGLMGSLAVLLRRSDALEGRLDDAVDGFGLPDGPRSRVTASMCAIVFEHGQSLKLLVAAGMPTSAIPLLRLQYECLVRAAWLLHAASDEAVSKLEPALSPETEQAAKRMPNIPAMLADLAERGPRGAARLLTRFRDRVGSGLNSFVHGGIHAVRRKADGYPEVLLCDVVKCSNAVSLLGLAVIAELSHDIALALRVGALNRDFPDCVPTMEPFPGD